MNYNKKIDTSVDALTYEARRWAAFGVYLALIIVTTFVSYEYLANTTLTITDNSENSYFRVLPVPKSGGRYFYNVTQNRDISTEITTLVKKSDWQKANKISNNVKDLSKVPIKKYSQLKPLLHETLSYHKIPVWLFIFYFIDFACILGLKKMFLSLKIYRISLIISKFLTSLPIFFYVAPSILLHIFTNDNMDFSGILELHQNISIPAIAIFSNATFFFLLDSIIPDSKS